MIAFLLGLTMVGAFSFVVAGAFWDRHNHCADSNHPCHSEAMQWAKSHRLNPAHLKWMGWAMLVLGILAFAGSMTFVYLKIRFPAI